MNGDGCDTCTYHDLLGVCLAIKSHIQFVDDDYSAYRAFFEAVSEVIEELDI